jgi:hypothetical protein
MAVLFWIFIAAAGLAAQTSNVEVDPIACWWRTTAGAVRVGEPFRLLLTCSVLTTQAARAIVDESRLDASVVQLPPFEVLGGRRAEDVTTASRRFLQYEYTLRTIEESALGRDLIVPPLTVSYRIESRLDDGESVQGRDQSYQLPPLSVRVLSVVPDTATDIREAPIPTFEGIEQLALRGTILRLVAVFLFALGVMAIGLAALGLLRRRRAAGPAADRLLSDRAVLDAVGRELLDVRAQSQAAGWTPDLMGRALAALRIAAAFTIGTPVVQQKVAPDRVGEAPDGCLAVAGRFGAPVLVSASVTPARTTDEGLRDALARLTEARYGRGAAPEPARLEAALDHALPTVDRLAGSRTWLAETKAAARRSLDGLRGRAWAR